VGLLTHHTLPHQRPSLSVESQAPGIDIYIAVLGLAGTRTTARLNQRLHRTIRGCSPASPRAWRPPSEPRHGTGSISVRVECLCECWFKHVCTLVGLPQPSTGTVRTPRSNFDHPSSACGVRSRWWCSASLTLHACTLIVSSRWRIPAASPAPSTTPGCPSDAGGRVVRVLQQDIPDSATRGYPATNPPNSPLLLSASRPSQATRRRRFATPRRSCVHLARCRRWTATVSRALRCTSGAIPR
jgi:hypothetical protein